MNIKINIALSLILLTGLAMPGCTSDLASDLSSNEEVTPGTQPIELSSVLANQLAAASTNSIYLTAKLNEDPSRIYFGETQISIPMLSTTPSPVGFPLARPYYPLADKAINLYAYSGKAVGGLMALKSGVGSQFDAVLSNMGQRGATPVDPATEGQGTVGSSADPASLLVFRHVMTQVIVSIQVDPSEAPNVVDPVPTTVQVGFPGAAADGKYSITAKAPVAGDEANAEKATGTSGSYTLQLGTNYIVPTGANLSGKKLTSLVIDDYKATALDLNNFIIQPQAGATDFLLLSGFSYNLTLVISRLQVVAVKITQVPWKVKEVLGTDVNYAPQVLGLNLGTYNNSGEHTITRVVLHTNDNKMYVGGTKDGSTDIDFVTLPPTANVTKAELYTAKGLLLSTPIVDEYENSVANKLLTIDLSKGGMFTEDPNQPYSATNPYVIHTPLQFLNINEDLTVNYKQVAVLDMNTLSVNQINSMGEFTGTLDGNGFWISNLYITGSGIFETNSGIIKNMRLYTGVIDATGKSYAGSFCGINNGTIVGSVSEISVSNSTATAGGICGQNAATGLLIANLNTGRVQQGSTVGGIAGENKNVSTGAITACVNIGALNPTAARLGGLFGASDASTNSVVNTCMWLVGSAEKFIGSREVAVGTENVGLTLTSSRDPFEMRNGMNEHNTEPDRIINQLNAELANLAAWKDVFHYILNPATTGITWPVPVKK